MSASSKSPLKSTELFRTSTLLTATAIWSFANGASAQDSASADAAGSAETIEEVVVTGFRASLNKALEAKQDQVGSIDMIVAEDIADFPDLNLAESLQRVPGVVIARDAGEGRQISVRGLGPQFTRVRINGIEAMSANGSTDATGGTNRGRNFDFNTFASELFNNITVRKTASAETEEGSLGATVDLRTGRPFDYDGFTVAGSVQAGYNDLTEDSDPRAAFLVSNTFADGKFGALFSVAYTIAQTAGRWFQHGALAAQRRHGNSRSGLPRGRCEQAHAGPDPRCLRAAYSALRPVRARSGATWRHCLVAVRTERRNLVQPRRSVLEVRCHARRNLPRGAGLQHRRRHDTELTSTRSTPREIDATTARWSTACSTTWTFAPKRVTTS